MLIKYLTLICASLIVTILASCGGANMSGFISPRKEKTDKSGAREVSEPAVVTGSYLTCDYSAKDDTGESQAVGCSMKAPSGNVIQPTAANKLAFYRIVKNDAYIKPDQMTNSSAPQALFRVPRAQLSESKYIATYANKWGMDEFSCDSLPCRQLLTPNVIPTYLALEPSATSSGTASAAFWSMEQRYTDAVRSARIFSLDLNFIDPSFYCSSVGSNRGFREGRDPGQDYFATIVLPGIPLPTFGKRSITAIDRMYAPLSHFSKHLLKDGSPKAVGNGCIVLSLRKRSNSVPNFYVDEMSKTGPKIEDEQFQIILPDTPANNIIAGGFLGSIP